MKYIQIHWVMWIIMKCIQIHWGKRIILKYIQIHWLMYYYKMYSETLSKVDYYQGVQCQVRGVQRGWMGTSVCSDLLRGRQWVIWERQKCRGLLCCLCPYLHKPVIPLDRHKQGIYTGYLTGDACCLQIVLRMPAVPAAPRSQCPIIAVFVCVSHVWLALQMLAVIQALGWLVIWECLLSVTWPLTLWLTRAGIWPPLL